VRIGAIQYTWYALVFLLFTLLPYVLMTVGSVLLWRRGRSCALLLMTLGFGAIVVGALAIFFTGASNALGYDFARRLAVLGNYVRFSGQFVAGIGLFWHVVRQGSAPRP
jgi:hypothetical protein